MRRHRLRLVDDGVGGFLERIAADLHAARAVGAAPDRHRVGVALHEADAAERHAEPLRHHLRIDGGVALAVRMGAGEDRHHAARIEAQRHAVVEHRRLFEEIAEPAPAQLAALLRSGGALGKARPVRELEALVHHMREVAAVVGGVGAGLVRHLRRTDEIAPPDLDRIDVDHRRGAIEQPLDQVGRFRPSGAAVGMHRAGVGEHALPHRMQRRHVVDAGRELDGEKDVHHRRAEGVRPDRVHRVDAQAEDLALVVERELAAHHLVAAVGVAEQRFRARRRPFHRPSEAARRPQHQPVVGIAAALHAEAAADVGRDHAQLGLRDLQHIGGKLRAVAVRVLRRRIERVGVVGGVVVADRGARLDRVGAQPIAFEPQRDRVARLGEGGVGRVLVAEGEREGDVAGVVVPDPRRARFHRVLDRGHRRQRLVVDLDQLGGVLRLRRVSATTNATRSPTARTLSAASSGRRAR